MSIEDIISGAEFPTQDFIILGGMKSPGKATVTAGAFKQKYDVQQPYGASGGSTIWHGTEIKQAQVLIELWDKSQFAEWERFRKAVLMKKPDRTALSVDHPVLAGIEFKECQVEEVSAWDQDDEGLWSCTISLLEFKRPKPALSKPIAAIPNAPAVVPTAQDAYDVQIQGLMGQLAKVAAGG